MQKVKEHVLKISKDDFIAFYKDMNDRSYTLLFYPKSFTKNWDQTLKDKIKEETKKFFEEVKSKPYMKTNQEIRNMDNTDGNSQSESSSENNIDI